MLKKREIKYQKDVVFGDDLFVGIPIIFFILVLLPFCSILLEWSRRWCDVVICPEYGAISILNACMCLCMCLWVYSCTCTIFHLMLTKYLQRKKWWYFLLLFLRRVRHFFLHTNALLFLMQSLSKCAVPPKWELHPTFLLLGLWALTFRACLHKHSLYFPLPPCRQRADNLVLHPLHITCASPTFNCLSRKARGPLKIGWNLKMCWGKSL